MGAVTLGCDIGQKVDPTAIAVVETETRVVAGRPSVHHLVRHLERLPLGTSYPDVAQRVQTVVMGVYRQLVAHSAPRPQVTVNPATGAGRVQYSAAPPSIRAFMDGTGVGQPVLDLMTAAGVRVVGVYFTHGDRRTVQADGSISLGKGWLVSRLQSLLQMGRILLLKTSEAEALAKELLDYEIKVDANANDTYGAFKVGSHDDLVTALGLATMDDGGPVSTPVIGPGRPTLRFGAQSGQPYLDTEPRRPEGPRWH